ncbi:hypothetical protein QCA50_012643 [Cerrena zonata]|uniref:Uncharacterized protein n=1 Tax=Cerrena zonata TaxID=2478898 RepID=A0AAW0FZ03_9APHY
MRKGTKLRRDREFKPTGLLDEVDQDDNREATETRNTRPLFLPSRSNSVEARRESDVWNEALKELEKLDAPATIDDSEEGDWESRNPVQQPDEAMSHGRELEEGDVSTWSAEKIGVYNRYNELVGQWKRRSGQLKERKEWIEKRLKISDRYVTMLEEQRDQRVEEWRREAEDDRERIREGQGCDLGVTDSAEESRVSEEEGRRNKGKGRAGVRVREKNRMGKELSRKTERVQVKTEQDEPGSMARNAMSSAHPGGPSRGYVTGSIADAITTASRHNAGNRGTSGAGKRKRQTSKRSVKRVKGGVTL